VAFTGKLGTSDSRPGNIVPGYGASVTPAPYIIIPSPSLGGSALYAPTLSANGIFLLGETWEGYTSTDGAALPAYAPYTTYYSIYNTLRQITNPPWNSLGTGWCFQI